MKPMTKSKVIAAALCLAAVTAALVYVFLAQQAGQARQNVQVMVAKRDMTQGTIIDASMLSTRTLPRRAVTAAVASSPEMLVGKVASREIKAGEPISMDSVMQKNRLAHIVPPFMRAVTVALDPIIGVGGFLKPGDHVDVIATFDINDGTITKTVLQDVQLLAIGPNVSREETDPRTGKRVKPSVQPNATLAVMPHDAETLILAESKGKLRLALRRPDDTEFVRTKGVTGRAVIGSVPPDVPGGGRWMAGLRETAPAPRAASATSRPVPSAGSMLPMTVGTLGLPGTEAQPETGKKVQIIRGTEVEEVVVPE